jgi:AAA+ ATPase superfamily predicted ATPase
MILAIVTWVTVTEVTIMRFYDRTKELTMLQHNEELSKQESKLTVITGRRRIGKTRLIRVFADQSTYLYFFVSKKNEALLCEEFLSYAKEKLLIPVFGKIDKLIDLLRLLFQYAEQHHFILIIDEFQELLNINRSLISELQSLWDNNKAKTKLHLIISGSVHSMIHKIFMDAKEPLFGRADLFFRLPCFPVSTLIEILRDSDRLTATNLLSLYMITGSIPRYIEILSDRGILDHQGMSDYIFSDLTPFVDEGKYLLIEEFGKEYQMYFSILELLAMGKTSRTEIESILNKTIGGYLERLEHDYQLIQVYRPVFSKPGTKNVKFKITDQFLALWFAYFYRYRSALEANNLPYIKGRWQQNYPQYAGYWLERLIEDIYRESGKYNLIGSYWEKGFTNQIDIVAINEADKKLELAEIKLNKDNIRISILKEKSKNIVSLYQDKGYRISYRALGLEDILSI